MGLYDLATGEAQPILKQATADETISRTMISPDGKHIAYSKSGLPETRGLYLVGVDGSNARRLVGGKDLSVTPWCWSPDGKQVLAGFYSQGKAETALVSVENGTFRIVGGPAYDGRFSPDGRYFALVRGENETEVVLVNNDGKESPVVRGGYSNPLWTPDGKRLLLTTYRSGKPDLWAIRIENGAPAGPLEFVQNNVPLLLGVTPNGEYYYNVRTQVLDLYVADVDPQTGALRSAPKQITSQGSNVGAAWSPDGEQLAYFAGGKVIIRSSGSGEVREVALKEPLASSSRLPVWFPDGRALLIHSYSGKLRRVDVQTGESRPLPDEAAVPQYQSTGNSPGGGITVLLSADGRTVYYLKRDRGSEVTRVVRRALEGGPETEVTRISSTLVGGFSLSPDGSRLALTTPGPTPGPAGTVWVAPASGGLPKEFYRATSVNPHHPAWNKDGSRLFVVLGWDGGDICVISGEGVEPAPLKIGLHMKSLLTVRPDGTQIVFVDEQWSNHLWMLKNLFGEVKKAR